MGTTGTRVTTSPCRVDSGSRNHTGTPFRRRTDPGPYLPCELRLPVITRDVTPTENLSKGLLTTDSARPSCLCFNHCPLLSTDFLKWVWILL